MRNCFFLLGILAGLIQLFQSLPLLVEDRLQLLLHLVHGGLKAVLIVELAHFPRHLGQQIIDSLGLFFSALDALLHQPAHRLLQITAVVHVVVELIEHGIGIERVPIRGIPTAVAYVHHRKLRFGDSN